MSATEQKKIIYYIGFYDGKYCHRRGNTEQNLAGSMKIGKTHKEVMTQEKNPVWQYFHCPENYHPDGDMESLEKLYGSVPAALRNLGKARTGYR